MTTKVWEPMAAYNDTIGHRSSRKQRGPSRQPTRDWPSEDEEPYNSPPRPARHSRGGSRIDHHPGPGASERHAQRGGARSNRVSRSRTSTMPTPHIPGGPPPTLMKSATLPAVTSRRSRPSPTFATGVDDNYDDDDQDQVFQDADEEGSTSGARGKSRNASSRFRDRSTPETRRSTSRSSGADSDDNTGSSLSTPDDHHHHDSRKRTPKKDSHRPSFIVPITSNKLPEVPEAPPLAPEVPELAGRSRTRQPMPAPGARGRVSRPTRGETLQEADLQRNACYGGLPSAGRMRSRSCHSSMRQPAYRHGRSRWNEGFEHSPPRHASPRRSRNLYNQSEIFVTDKLFSPPASRYGPAKMSNPSASSSRVSMHDGPFGTSAQTLVAPRPSKDSPFCAVCLKGVSPRRSVRLECGHRNCYDCLRVNFELSISDPKFMPPRCCEAEGEIPTKLVEHLFADKFKQIWNAKFAEYSVRSRLYCRKCGEWIKPRNIRRTGPRPYARCDHCSMKVCSNCNCRWHGKRECPIEGEEETRLFIKKARREGRQRCYGCQEVIVLEGTHNPIQCRCGAETCLACGDDWKTCKCPWFLTAADEDAMMLPLSASPDRLDVMASSSPRTIRGAASVVFDGVSVAGRPWRPPHDREFAKRRILEQRDRDMARRRKQLEEMAYDDEDMDEDDEMGVEADVDDEVMMGDDDDDYHLHAAAAQRHGPGSRRSRKGSHHAWAGAGPKKLVMTVGGAPSNHHADYAVHHGSARSRRGSNRQSLADRFNPDVRKKSPTRAGPLASPVLKAAASTKTTTVVPPAPTPPPVSSPGGGSGMVSPMSSPRMSPLSAAVPKLRRHAHDGDMYDGVRSSRVSERIMDRMAPSRFRPGYDSEVNTPATGTRVSRLRERNPSGGNHTANLTNNTPGGSSIRDSPLMMDVPPSGGGGEGGSGASTSTAKNSARAGLSGPGQGAQRVREWRMHVEPGVPQDEEETLSLPGPAVATYGGGGGIEDMWSSEKWRSSP